MTQLEQLPLTPQNTTLMLVSACLVAVFDKWTKLQSAHTHSCTWMRDTHTMYFTIQADYIFTVWFIIMPTGQNRLAEGDPKIQTLKRLKDKPNSGVSATPEQQQPTFLSQGDSMFCESYYLNLQCRIDEQHAPG